VAATALDRQESRMTSSDPAEMERTERRGLLLSVFGALSMGALGIGFALVAESQAVLLDGLVSIAVAFLIVVLLRDTRLDWFLPYADPAVVIALGVLSAPIPFQIIRRNWNQLLGRAPNPDVQRGALSRVDAAGAGLPEPAPHLRILETGRLFYLQVYLIAGPLYLSASSAAST
jgi:predicted Co/Zn/Cd cation transporter (cation efflux family)